MARVYNFSAGPAVLPEEVLAEAASEMLDYRGSGMSVMEMSHRSKPFGEIIENAEADLRELVGIPENYRVLFLQGGASQQFAAVPMNLMRNRVADYIITGAWAKKAFKEAKIYGDARAIASSEDETFSYIPDCSDLDVSPDADYVYICENNTIYGTKFHTLPNTKGKDLVADVSSCFLSEPVDITKYGVMYGGAQKNIGPAGVVISIIREDLITDDVLEGTPTMLKWKTQADANSLYNTPPAYGIYICGKVFKWLKDQGGLEAMQKRNQEKAALLYDFLDASKLFRGTVRKEDRSLMNVPFVAGDADLDAAFVAEAMAAGLDLPILNPNVDAMMAAVRCYHLLMNIDTDAREFIAAYGNATVSTSITSAAGMTAAPAAGEKRGLEEIVEAGLKGEAGEATRALLESRAPLDVVDHVLIPALDRVGAAFEAGKVFLPQLIQSAGAAQAAFEVIRERLSGQPGQREDRGTIVLATVKGDIHDIGKNIVKVLLENYGYTVVDLGKDVDPAAVAEAVRKHRAPLVGLSALMTTTLKSMADTIALLHLEGLPCKIMVGGAVLTPEYASQIQADFYARDAKESVDIAKRVIG